MPLQRSLNCHGGACGGGGGGLFGAFVFAATADGDIAQGATFGPVPLAGSTEMARLRLVVVVVVTELGVE